MIYLNGQTLNTTIFPDGTSQVWKLPETLIGTKNTVKWKFTHEGEFIELAQLKQLLDTYGSDHTILELTYLPYGRQDKEVSNSSTFALRTFSTLLNSLNFDKVVILDPHSSIALELIKNSSAIYPTSQLQQIMLDTGTTLVCYPDKGAVTKYSQVYKELVGSAYIYGDKVRDQLTGNITHYQIVGDSYGENILIVDDICDGGATFKLLAKDLLAAGANSVVLFVSHGIFSRGMKTLMESGITRVFTANGEVTPRSTQ